LLEFFAVLPKFSTTQNLEGALLHHYIGWFLASITQRRLRDLQEGLPDENTIKSQNMLKRGQKMAKPTV